jgi:hypothetical protein
MAAIPSPADEPVAACSYSAFDVALMGDLHANDRAPSMP